MTYNFELAMSTYVSPTVVEDMVKQIVEAQTGKTVDRIEVKYNETAFDGFNIQFVSEIGKPATEHKKNIFDKTFKPAVWK